MDKKKRDNKRYKLHYRIKRQEPESYKVLDVRNRTFSKPPTGRLAKKLVNEFQYSIQLRIK